MSNCPNPGKFANLVPGDDFELNLLLLKIGQNLDQTEFEQLKFLCSGSNGVPKRILEQLSTPEKLFTYLKEQKRISKDNLLLLQAFMCHLKRDDLRNKAADYARRIGDALYFHTPNPRPEDGFKHVQFHVEGNLDKFQRSDLEALRATVARLLFVPEQNIILKGMEPSGSLTLTFMISQNEADSLKELFKEHKDSFGRLGVDGISIDDVENIDPSLSLRRRGSAPAGAATQAQLEALYQRSLQLESQVEESEVRSLESRADATVARQEALEWRRKENYFRCLLARIVEEHTEGDILRKPARRRASILSCPMNFEIKESPITPAVQTNDVELLFV